MGSIELRYSYLILLLFSIKCIPAPNHSGSIQFWETTFLLKPVAQNLIVPWDMEYDDQGYIWFTEKIGNVYRMKDRTWELELIHHIDDVFVSSVENAGLHSMLFHPDWPDSAFVYCHYTYSVNRSKLVRYYFDPHQKKLTSDRDIFSALPAARSHNGSRMTIDESGCILFCIGEAYRFHPAQDTLDYSGKVLRFNPDGSIPSDNPFDNHVWSLGHRNPQGLYYAENGILYSSEHGPGTDDEINIITKGGNYGWPDVNGYCDEPKEKEACETKNLIEPIWTWTPTEAPSNLSYYHHDHFPEWRNSLMQCFLKGGRMHWIPLSEDGTMVEAEYRFFCADIVRIRDILSTPDGRIFLCSSNREVHKPFSFPNDDKIIEVRNLNLDSNLTIHFSVEETKRSFQIESNQYLPPGEISIVDHIGNPLLSEEIEPQSHLHTIAWWPQEKGYYFVKIKLDDGMNIQKRFTY